MILGYAVSYLHESDYEGQRRLLDQAGCNVVYDDGRVSRSAHHFPAFRAALTRLESGWTLVVADLGRIARSSRDLLKTLHRIDQSGARLIALQEGVDTDSALSPLSFAGVRILIDFERNEMLERARDTAKTLGRQGLRPGRKPALTSVEVSIAKEMLNNGETTTRVASRLGVDRSTLYRTLSRSEYQESA